MINPSKLDLELIFGILRYLHGTIGEENARMTMRHNEAFDDPDYKQNPCHLLTDADLGNCHKTKRSRSGYVAYLYGNLVAWKSSKQTQVSLRTCESEFVALSLCAQFSKWYKGLISDMGIEIAYCEP